MSSFAALFAEAPTEPAALAAALAPVADRIAPLGPEGLFTETNAQAAFASARLVTTDRDAAAHRAEQAGAPNRLSPLVACEGALRLAADLRLDGRAALLDALRAAGARIPPSSADSLTDAELLLHAYLCWGLDTPRHLTGAFAFAIWDARSGPPRLIAARDLFGIKPLFWAELPHATGPASRPGLLVGTRLGALREHASLPQGFSDDLDEDYIADFLLFELSQDRRRTAFRSVRRVPPAHLLLWLPGAPPQVRRYTELPVEPPDPALKGRAAVEAFREVLAEAVRDRIRTDRATVLLSGGMDSPAVAALAVRERRGLALSALTAVSSPPEEDPEAPYARIVAEYLGLPHRLFPNDHFPLYTPPGRPDAYLDEPVHDPELAKHAAALDAIHATGHRVVLTGYGAAECIFVTPHGYLDRLISDRRYGLLALELARYTVAYRQLPRLGLRQRLLQRFGRAAPPAPAYPFPSWVHPDFRRRLNLDARWAEAMQPTPALHPVHPEAYRQTVHPFWTDAFELMAPGTTGLPIEQRHPLMDARVLRFLLRLPPIPWTADKRLLREAMRDLLPERIRTRPKTPLATAPVAARIARGDAERLRTLALHPAIDPFVDRAAAARVLGEGPALQGDMMEGWVDLRVASLNAWLQRLDT